MPTTPPERRLRLVVVLLAWAGLAGGVIAQSPPSSGARPDVRNRPVGPLVRFVASLREVVAQLDLTPEQRRTVLAVMQQELEQLRELAPELGGMPPAERRSRVGELAGRVVTKVRESLPPDQRAAFDQRTGALLAGVGVPTVGAGASPEGDAMMSGDGGGGTPSSRPGTPTPPAVTTRPAPMDPQAPTPLVVGEPAPELAAIRLDNGRVANLASLPARPRVLIFGSHSAPTLRDGVAAINQLQRDYRGRAEVIVIYTAEAYPAGVWDIDRNRQDKVRIEAHRTEADRVAVAREAKTVLGLEVGVLVDQMTDATARAYGLMPNGAVLVGRDGTVLAVQRWFDPHGMRRSVDEAVRNRPASGAP